MNPVIQHLHNIDLSQIELSGPHDPNIKLQDIYINYFDKNNNMMTKMLMQSDQIELLRSNSSVIIEENNCAQNDHAEDIIQIPIDPTQDNCLKLKNFVENIDRWAQSPETRTKLFGEKSDSYIYESTLKSYEGNFIKDFIQMKFNIIISDNDNRRKNMTKFVKKIHRIKMTMERSSIKSLNSELKIGTKIRFIFFCNKVWVAKNDQSNNFTYGVGLKIIAIEYEPRNYNIDFENVDFEDSNDDSHDSDNDSDNSSNYAN